MCVYNGYSISLDRSLGNIKLKCDQMTLGHKALFFRRNFGSKLLKVLFFDLEMGYSLEGSMSVHSMYAQIVLATKKFYHGFLFLSFSMSVH